MGMSHKFLFFFIKGSPSTTIYIATQILVTLDNIHMLGLHSHRHNDDDDNEVVLNDNEFKLVRNPNFTPTISIVYTFMWFLVF